MLVLTDATSLRMEGTGASLRIGLAQSPAALCENVPEAKTQKPIKRPSAGERLGECAVATLDMLGTNGDRNGEQGPGRSPRDDGAAAGSHCAGYRSGASERTGLALLSLLERRGEAWPRGEGSHSVLTWPCANAGSPPCSAIKQA